ncbi:MAG: flavin reductase family protein [Candidatus Binataceae bacterium]
MEPNLARAFAELTTGIYVLTVNDDGRCHGMSSSWVTQVSGEPPLLVAAVDRSHLSHGVIERTRAFGLNVVGRRGKALEDYFYSARSRRADNLDDVAYELSPMLRVPWLTLAMVAIEARVRDAFTAGDHTLFVAEPAGVSVRAKDTALTSLDLEYVYLGGNEIVRRE